MKLPIASIALLSLGASAFAPAHHPAPLRSLTNLYDVDPRRQADSRSLAEKMFGTLTSAFSGGEQEEKVVVEQGPLEASKAISEIDQRAIEGKITFQDFIAMSRTFAELGGNVPGMPKKLSAQEVAETRAKFAKHEKIVQAMTPEELMDPQLMCDDLEDVENKCPRVQRLALNSGVSEKDVALFVAEFEAMRQSTQRIAAGEDPDEVDRSMGEGKGNRAARRATKKRQRQAKTEW